MKNAHLTALDTNPSPRSSEASNPDLRRSGTISKPNLGHAPGDILAGKYEIVSLLGEGGMGTVWRARSLMLDVDIAIKVLHCDRADAQAAQRLLREARATASVGHPSIVRAFDFGETEAGEPFLVMELLEGISLADWLDLQGRMPATQAVQMLLPIASGLAAAHARGIIHRDVKPENIIIVPDGAATCIPKIVDFGIAKMARTGQVITQAGMVVGSLEYMSPEQAEGKQEVTEQTDVWALCVVLYELITGRRPFEGETITKMIYALYTLDPVPVTSYAAGDDELWAILARGLQKAPEDRWPTMLELGRALAGWAHRQGITTDASGRSLELHWLADTTETADKNAISGTRPISAPYWPRVSLAAVDTSAKTEARPALPEPQSLPRLGTIELACAANDRRAPAPASRRARPPMFGALVALIAAPLAIAATIYASSGTGNAPSAAPVAVAVAAPVAAGPTWPATAPAQAEPAASPKPSGTTAPSSKTRAQKPSSSSTPSHGTKVMPLPAAPNF